MEIVSAGDIEKYSYCPLSWWLSKNHKTVAKKGVENHKKIETELKEIRKKEKILGLYEKYILFISIASSGIALLGISFMYGGMERIWNIFFVFLAFLWLYNSIFFLYKESKASEIIKPKYEKGILISSSGAIIVIAFFIILSLPPNIKISKFAEILALLWVVSANLLFYHSINISEKLIEKKIKYAPINGTIEYIGAFEEGEEITSSKYGIRGKPDYIIKRNNEYIPVEEKSSNLNHPKFSHVMQITAYCMLIEDKYGSPPPYGVLKYRNRQFKIPYEDRWKNMVIKIRKNMIKDMERGEAHRNHNNKNKCLHCARREYCPEKLL